MICYILKGTIVVYYILNNQNHKIPVIKSIEFLPKSFITDIEVINTSM